ncbi:RNA-binding protein 7 [Sitodiplosis mosellana]|uniref:RNA-binding protein 7 n=1 Tax=Sitodiplosis mosellana TaxID=263140 RepID=UPI002444F48F|nr:RNA-binding protein 7 [Sitodiplosis mosellana]
MNDDHDARTIHCGNLYADKITEELLYELFVQAGPLERVAIPKDNGKNRQYAFVTYKHVCSVPYAMSIFAGTKLFNRELRLNNRCLNRNNNNETNQTRGQNAHVPPPVLPNIPPTHQFQMQNPFGNNALRSGGGDNNQHRGSMNQNNKMMPSAPIQQLQFPPNSQLDFAMLLAQSAQMLSYANGLGANNGGGDGGNDNNGSQKRQSKMTHRQEHRSHNQNSNYSRDRDRRKNHSRSKSPNPTDWIRNQGREDSRSNRHGRDRDRDRDRGRNQRNDNSRRRNDRR